MANSVTSFEIHNETDKDMEIIHEPECFEFVLPPGERLTIEVDSCEQSVVLCHSLVKDTVILSILDHKSLYTVRYKGVDVFRKYKE